MNGCGYVPKNILFRYLGNFYLIFKFQEMLNALKQKEKKQYNYRTTSHLGSELHLAYSLKISQTPALEERTRQAREQPGWFWGQAILKRIWGGVRM